MAPFLPMLEQLASLALRGAAPSPALNTVRHHDMHHRFPRTHFSLYFTHWDRLCGTEHPRYRADVAAHFAEGQLAEGKAEHPGGAAHAPVAVVAAGDVAANATCEDDGAARAALGVQTRSRARQAAPAAEGW
jgi:hypothetical protein